MLSLKPRLSALIKSVESTKGAVLADIGTDHGYVPIVAITRNLCDRAIACDISPGPLDIAMRNIKAAGLEGFIETRLGDGLSPLHPREADTIVISGMGGMAMISILEADLDLARGAGLVLQPQHDLEELRRRLGRMSFSIESETLAREGERFYVVINAVTGSYRELSDKECFVGLGSGSDWVDYLSMRAKKIERYIDLIKDSDALAKASQQLGWLQEHIANGKLP